MIQRALVLLDRYGTSLLAAGLFIGFALQPLAHVIAPSLPALVFLLTISTLLRIDWPQVIMHGRRPGRIALVVLWSLVLTPVFLAAAGRALGLPDGLAQALVVWGASPPLMSVPAIAMLMGLGGALALLAMITATFLMPLSLPPLLLGLIGLKLGIGIASLMARLALFVVGAAAVAELLRRLAGAQRLARLGREINGLNVLLLVLFAIAIMDGMWKRVAAEPLTVLAYSAAALGTSLALQGMSFLAFAWFDRESALTVGLIGGNKNMAVVWANLGAAQSPDLLLFFVCAQLPIYILPAMLAPIYRRLGGSARAVARAD